MHWGFSLATAALFKDNSSFLSCATPSLSSNESKSLRELRDKQGLFRLSFYRKSSGGGC